MDPDHRTGAWRRALREEGRASLVRATSGLAMAASIGACGIEPTSIVLTRVPDIDASVDREVAPVDAVAEAACPACPRVVVLTGETNTLLQGGEGGTPYVDVCPEGQAVIGYHGSLNTNGITKDGVPITIIGSIQTVCGHVSVDDSTAIFAAIRDGDTLPARPPKPNTWHSVCPNHGVVVGFTSQSGVVFENVAFQCAQLRITKGPTGDVVSPDTSTFQLLPRNGGDAGSPASAVVCPEGTIARGGNTRAGSWVDAFGLNCATPTIVRVDTGACCS